MGNFSSVLILIIVASILVMPASATYSKSFAADTTVVVNQSYVQDPTDGSSIPWALWVIAGISGLALIVLSLVRSKTQRMDYEINIVISVLAWPFILYWALGGMTSVDYVVGNGITSSCSDTTIMITQHIIYTPWVLGWIGISGFVFTVFVTTLLVSQYNLFRDNEAEATARKQQQEMTDENQ